MEDSKKNDRTISSHDLNRGLNGEPSWAMDDSEKVGLKRKKKKKRMFFLNCDDAL